jgi:threonine aldolase
LERSRRSRSARRLCQIDDPHFSHTTLLALENTANRGGGACYTLAEFAATASAARENGLRVHCDGARLFNAAAAMGVTVADYAAHCDTVCFCLSKGLGAPAGSLLAGSRAVMKEALRYRKQLGGGMRQAGVLAAAGMHALTRHVADLAEDHRRTRALRSALEDAGYTFPLPSPTNILYIGAPEPFALVGALAEAGVLTLPHGEQSIRAVLHRDIGDDALAIAIGAFHRFPGGKV